MIPWTHTRALPAHCEPQGDFLAGISSLLGTCIPTYTGFFSTLLGNLSILAWLFAQMPQVFKNYRLQSTAGLSVYFLIEWLLGDTTNLVGAILTHQASWQVVLATYYTTVDVVLVCQYFYYTRFHPIEERVAPIGDTTTAHEGGPGQTPSGACRQGQDERDAPALDRQEARTAPATKSRDAAFGSFRFPGHESSPHEKSTSTASRPIVRSPRDHSSLPKPNPKTLLAISILCAVATHASPLQNQQAQTASDDNDDDMFSKEAIGRTVSWLSAFLYLGSRLPQIYKNHARRSTTGLSPTLFIAAFFGNLFYSSSLLTNPLAWDDYPAYGHFGWAPPEGSRRDEWVGAAIPFFLGAAGVLALDLTVGIQFIVFGKGREEPQVVVAEDMRGRDHWRKVSGWMRGWIPSPTPGQTFGHPFDQGSDDERPLLQRGGSYDSSRQYGGA